MRWRAAGTQTCREEARAGVSARQSRGDVARPSGPGGAACARWAPAVEGWPGGTQSRTPAALVPDFSRRQGRACFGQQPRACR